MYVHFVQSTLAQEKEQLLSEVNELKEEAAMTTSEKQKKLKAIQAELAEVQKSHMKVRICTLLFIIIITIAGRNGLHSGDACVH